MLLYTRMKKQMIFWNLLTLMIFGVNSVDILMDPEMREGNSSYIYCDIGAITAGVTFYTEPNNVQGSCFGTICVSTLYTITKNATGINLAIASVNASREEGEWYCQHDNDRSNTITVNNHTIAGILLGQNWTEPSGPVDTVFAVMTLSCTNKVPNVSFTYEDGKSNTGIVPTEAVSMTNQSLYDGTTCENGNKFYEITLTASNRLDIFNNKQGVKFSFTYYGKNITAPFSVDFTALSESTTESPNTTVPDCIFCLIIIIIALVLLVLLLIIYHLVIFFVKVSFLVMGILFFVNAFLAVVAVAIGIVVCVLYAEVVELILAIIAIVIGVLTNLYKLFFSKHVLKKADVPHRHLFCGFFAYPWKTGDASGDETNTEMKNQNDHKKDDKKDDKKHDKKDDKEKKDEKNVESEDPTGRPLPPRTTQKTSDFAIPKPKMKPKEGNGEELKPLRDAPRGGLPSPRVNHNDNDSASSASNVTPHVA